VQGLTFIVTYMQIMRGLKFIHSAKVTFNHLPCPSPFLPLPHLPLLLPSEFSLSPFPSHSILLSPLPVLHLDQNSYLLPAGHTS